MTAIPHRRIGATELHVSELGFGAAAIGNLYRTVSDGDASAALTAAFELGLGYIDTAPYYGFGLSERRVGNAARGKADAVISTKVGRLLCPDTRVKDDSERHGFRSALPFTPIYDYGYDGIMRSHDDSLQRLGLARIDILYVHDIGGLTHGAADQEQFDALTHGGGFRALEHLRSTNQISAFGIGVNEIDACLRVMDYVDLDVILLAGRYTLLEHLALDKLFPRCKLSNTSIVIGGPYNSGILATGTREGGPVHYDYSDASEAIVARVRAIEDGCDVFGIPLAAAALQFPLAHPQVSSVIPGLESAARVEQTVKLYNIPIPGDFWSYLRDAGLIDERAPVSGKSMPS